jgi:uncharacterized lipoprotein NlpE involved in copper resistance
MKKIFIVLMVLSLLVLVGCSDHFEYEYSVDDETIEGSVDGDDYHAEVTNDDGTTEIEVHVENEDSWCQTGSTWASTGNDGSASMVVEGIIEEGEYEGFCHIIMNTETSDAETTSEYYINEDSTEGYYVMNVNGEEFKYSWSG